MHIIEIKNNLVKIEYEPSLHGLILAGFVTIKDETQTQNPSFIAQVMHLEAIAKVHTAIVKMLFNFDSTGVVTNYSGAIPDIKSEIYLVETSELLGLLPVQNPVVIGELAGQKTILKLDETIFKEKLVVCSERECDNKLLVENINAQLTNLGKKLLVIDLSGDYNFSANKVVSGEDFRLPLNYETINFIYEKGLDDANPETRALIQEVFLEVQEYVKSLPEKFIPFDTFKNVVDEQYKELGIVELVLLKNKLLKYYEDGIFAQEKVQFESLEQAFMKKGTVVLDLSKVEENIQREVISYAYSLIGQFSGEIFVIVNVNNSNSDKKLLKQIFTSKVAFSSVICSYSYKYLTELKQIAKDLILFAPINQQKDFASYSTFFSKLNPDEFIIYGSATHHLPLIVKLDKTPQAMIVQTVQPEQIEPTVEHGQDFGQEPLVDDELDQQIMQDVDQIYTAPSYEKEQEEFAEESFYEAQADCNTEGLTENDLDFIDDLNIIQESDLVEDSFGEAFKEDFEESQDGVQEAFFAEDMHSQTQASQDLDYDDFSQEQVNEEPPAIDILPASEASIPSVPIYSAEIEQSMDFTSDELEQGDTVVHAKYGKGSVEKLISYGSKTLCSIHFDNVGRRLLDPSLAELKKV